MTRQEIAALACKLFALWFFCQAVMEFFRAGASALMAIPGAVSGPHGVLAFVLVQAAETCCYALLAMVLWRFSNGIASVMVSHDISPVTAKNLDFRSLLSVAIAAIGVFIAVETIPAIGRALYIMWQMAQPDWSSPDFSQRGHWESGLWSQMAKLALAIWLIFGSRGIARIIRRWRSARPTKPIDPKPSQDPGM